MALDVLPQLGRRRFDMTFRQLIHNELMTFDTGFPPSLIHTLAEPLKEDVQQIAERDERLQSARFQQ